MKQKLGTYVLDLLTGDELRGHLKDTLASNLLQMYRGISYPSFTGLGGAATVAIPGPASGYAWSLRSLSVQCSAATPVSAYLGENATVAPIATGATSVNGGNNELVIMWATKTVILADERPITVVAGTGNILTWRLAVQQVPGEMTGKL